MEGESTENLMIAILIFSFFMTLEESNSELDRFQGTWVLTRMESGGKKAQEELVVRGEYHLMVLRNKVIVNQEAAIHPMGTLKLDPTRRPKVYDRILNDDRLCRGIYELDRDQLKICLGFPGVDRPKDFSTKVGEQSSLMFYTRYEPQSAAFAPGADRSAGQILKAIDSLKMSAFDLKRMEDREYIREYQAKHLSKTERRAELILELYKAAPNHERIPSLMVERWRHGHPASPNAEAQIEEIDTVLAHSGNRYLKLEGTYLRARAKLLKHRLGGSPIYRASRNSWSSAPGTFLAAQACFTSPPALRATRR
jgi:uncharacterized protein (TIGR03067 family)